jgi:isopentenyl diphosphate isomerase/L-lactate dehydrogenase-like FMN-dependent dehydrogenase
MTFQQIADIPDEQFEEYIEEKRENIANTLDELTTAGIIRLAKSIDKEDKPKKERDINDVVDTMSKDLQAILNTFSQITDHWDSVDVNRREKLAIKLKRLISIFQSLQEKQKEKNEKKLKLLQITHEEEE